VIRRVSRTLTSTIRNLTFEREEVKVLWLDADKLARRLSYLIQDW
jgi:hypothetical protein